MEKKLKRRADIREVIVGAAKELFSKKGYHNTQVADLIRHVGMSANTFYAFFRDKKDLFEEVATKSLDDLRTTLKKMRKTKNADDIVERLERMTETYNTLFDFMEQNPQQMLLIIRGGFGVDEKLDEDIWRYYSYFASDLAEDFKKWKRIGFVDGFDPLVLGHIVQGMTIQVAHSYLVERKFSREKAIEHLIQVNRAILSTYLTEKGKKRLGLSRQSRGGAYDSKPRGSIASQQIPEVQGFFHRARICAEAPQGHGQGDQGSHRLRAKIQR